MSFIGLVVNALVFSVLGVMVFGVSFYISDKLTPVNLWKEIVDEKNVAVAIVAGAIAIAIGNVIAAAVHG